MGKHVKTDFLWVHIAYQITFEKYNRPDAEVLQISQKKAFSKDFHLCI